MPDEEARYIIGQVAVGVFDTDQPRLADLALARFGQITGFDDSAVFVGEVLATTSFSDRGAEWQFSTRYVRWLRPYADEGNAEANGLIGLTLLESVDGMPKQARNIRQFSSSLPMVFLPRCMMTLGQCLM